jgi:MFS family permease
MAVAEKHSAFGGKPVAPVILLSLGHGATHYTFGTLIILVPFIKQALNLSYTEAGLIVAVFHVTGFFANFVTGLAVDVSGRRMLFMVLSALLCGATTFALGVSSQLVMICIASGLMAIGVQGWHPAAFSYLAEEYEKAKGLVFSIHVVAANMGEALAFQIGGLLIAAFGSWQLAAMAGAVPGLLFGVILLVFMLPKERAASAGAARGMGIKDYVSGYVQLLTNKPAMMVCLVSALRTMAQNGLMVFVPFYLLDNLAVSAALTGTAMLLMQVTGGVATPVGGYTADRFGPRPVLFVCITFTSVAIVAATLVTDPTSYIVCIALIGFVLFAIRPVLQRWIVDLVPNEFRGSATSVMFSMQAAANAITPIIGGWIADTYGMLQVFYFLAAIMLTANLVTAVLPKSNPADNE